jgi:hypothetical protein
MCKSTFRHSVPVSENHLCLRQTICYGAIQNFNFSLNYRDERPLNLSSDLDIWSNLINILA